VGAHRERRHLRAYGPVVILVNTLLSALKKIYSGRLDLSRGGHVEEDGQDREALPRAVRRDRVPAPLHREQRHAFVVLDGAGGVAALIQPIMPVYLRLEPEALNPALRPNVPEAIERQRQQ